ncbi:hypothetical protein TRIP_C20567 [Candidatus Zixiibacteriota bacterium]|nr:hypothetical protein TRIP_C20567 [candidate division Zixibacteria bacterium]
MSKFKFLLLLLVPIIVTGCLSTLHPLYSEPTKFFDPGLIGYWTQGEDNDTLIFNETGKKRYQFIYSDKGKHAEFEVYLAKLGETYFIDMLPVASSKENDLWSMLMVPTHMFGVYKRIGDSLELNMLNDDWLEKKLKDKSIALPFEETDNNIVLTAATEQLQKFAETYAADTAVFKPDKPFYKIR